MYISKSEVEVKKLKPIFFFFLFSKRQYLESTDTSNVEPCHVEHTCQKHKSNTILLFSIYFIEFVKCPSVVSYRVRVSMCVRVCPYPCKIGWYKLKKISQRKGNASKMTQHTIKEREIQKTSKIQTPKLIILEEYMQS